MNQALKDHAMLPCNMGAMPHPDGYANPTGPCGESMEIFLEIDGENINRATYIPHGCAFTVACGSLVTEMAKGLSLQDALDLEGETLEKAFDGLPEDHKHCAELAATSLHEAVSDYFRTRRAPWKKLYAK